MGAGLIIRTKKADGYSYGKNLDIIYLQYRGARTKSVHPFSYIMKNLKAVRFP